MAGAVLAALCCAGSAFAAGRPGTSAFQFLQLGVGARPSGMGEVFAGVAGDVNSLYWNPAGLAGLERPELSMTHALWLEDITYSNFVYARPALGGVAGVGFNILNSGSIQKADNSGLRLSEKYSMSDMLGALSYARAWGNLALAANLKYISSALEDESAHSYAADAGALYTGFRPFGRRLGLGLSVQNLGAKAKYVSEEAPLPSIVRAGASLALSGNLLVGSDLVYAEKTVNIHGGAEYTRKLGGVVLAARAGYKNDTVKELGALSGLTAGLGLRLNDFQLDYSWNSFTDLGVTHRLSVGIKFGASDGDSDGVADPSDKCPGTPAGAAVNAAGCPLDSDADGVADYLDKCPGTPAGTMVDAAGCPVNTDADGVADYLDKCPGTPAGVAVNAAGCPLDGDADGVADYLDKCPGTPAAIAVDAGGCAAGSPAEMQALDRLALVAAPDSVTPGVVDAVRGAAGDPACPWDLADKLCMKLAMAFDYDKAEVKGDFAAQLKEIAAFMAANPRARIELRGYTDDRGEEDYNLNLSKGRAGSVLKHLVETSGIDAGRLSAKGMGKADPIASNQTAEGQQRNRRVIAILTMDK